MLNISQQFSILTQTQSNKTSKSNDNSIGFMQSLNELQQSLKTFKPAECGHGILIRKTNVNISINLNATQAQATGASISGSREGISAKTIIQTTANNTQRGDIVNISNGIQSADFTFGGFTIGRQVTTGAAGDTALPNNPNRVFTGNIMDAINENYPFLFSTRPSQFTEDSLSLSITTKSTGTITFNYTQAAPDPRQKQFNNMSGLGSAINEIPGLTAKIENGRLYVGATDANEAVTFANGNDGAGGIDWVGELGLKNIAAGTKRFSSMAGLSGEIKKTSIANATIDNPLGESVLTISAKTITDRLRISNGPTNSGSLAYALGLTNSTDPYLSSNLLAPLYDPTLFYKTMASGNLAANFSRQIAISDSKGVQHEVVASFLKKSENNWAVELYANNASDLKDPNKKLIAYGDITFDKNGKIASISRVLEQTNTIEWANNTITKLDFDFVRFTQKNSPYQVNYVNIK